MSKLSPICQKRLKGDLKVLKKEPLELACSRPDTDNPLIWYFVLKGPKDSHYKGGYYLGKIEHSPEYPFKPPDFYFYTPSGRFHLNKKICLSNSGYHKEEWSATWNIRNLLIGLLSIFLDDGPESNGIGRLKDTQENRQKMAKQSVSFNIQNYEKEWEMFKDFYENSKDE